MITHLLWLHTYYDYTPTMITHLLWLHTYYDYTHTMITHLLWLHTYYDYTPTMITHLLWLHTYYDYTPTMITHILRRRGRGRARPIICPWVPADATDLERKTLPLRRRKTLVSAGWPEVAPRQYWGASPPDLTSRLCFLNLLHVSTQQAAEFCKF